MRVKVGELAADLKRRGLAPIYFISGDEPLQIKESLDCVRNGAKARGFDERLVFDAGNNFNWASLLEEQASPSLFSPRRLLELGLGTAKPGVAGGKVLVEYAKRVGDETADKKTPQDAANVLLISAARVDKKAQQSKWFQALDAAGVIVQVWPVDAERLPDWISARLRRLGKGIEADAAQLLAQYVEGNMLAAAQEIDKLSLLVDGREITAADVAGAMVDCARANVFSMIECAYTAQHARLLRMLNGLRTEGVDIMALYGALSWDLRRVCGIAREHQEGAALEKLFVSPRYRVFDERRRQAIRLMLRRHSTAKLEELLARVNALGLIIKSQAKPLAWDIMQALLLAFSGRELYAFELEGLLGVTPQRGSISGLPPWGG